MRKPYLVWILLAAGANAAKVDLRQAVVVTRTGERPEAERMAATMLVEELERRSGIRLPIATNPPAGGVAVSITSGSAVTGARAEGYRLWIEPGDPRRVHIEGADARGALYGAGHLLRLVEWGPGRLELATPLDVTTSPAYPIRGHQLGYRATANSYDAWTVTQYEQYVRELAIFGANAIENIPAQDERSSPVMTVSRSEMNRAISLLCRRYGLDYWIWLPVTFDLKDPGRKRAGQMLEWFDQYLRDTPLLTGVFVPGGDPGHNAPEDLVPYLAQLAKRLRSVHPQAHIWLSLQGFDAKQAEWVYQYLEKESPDWLAGLVAGPSSPPVAGTRMRLPAKYKLRLYPDLTHNKICQFQVPELDQAIALTLGREAVNPRPVEFARIHNWYAPYSDGFISYSDGAHDDVNKDVWSALSWDPSRRVRDILTEYARFHFGPEAAGEATDGILALEGNWHGPLEAKGAAEGTLLLWRRLETRFPRLAGNWRWQMMLLRAYYDAHVRRRLLQDSALEREANGVLASAGAVGADAAMSQATKILDRAASEPVSADLRARIADLCERLYRSIGLQTSVTKYHSSGAERGAVLDFVDLPLNNRWWLEDEFARVRQLASEEEKAARLRTIAAWETPGPGSFYDHVGNPAKAPHLVNPAVDPVEPEEDRVEPLFWWWDQGRSRARLTWQATMWPRALVYEGLDAKASYVVRASGYGKLLLRIDGERVTGAPVPIRMGEIQETPVPSKYFEDRKLVLTWDIP
ncbi:MAG: glycoside hydrolase family 20 zincin-like fold domain-containing protein, partial [Bryobacteraceae bacterium]